MLPDHSTDRRRHARIKYELELRGLTLADITRQAKVSTSAVSTVWVGKNRSMKIEALLAAAFDTTAVELLPERYTTLRGDRE